MDEPASVPLPITGGCQCGAVRYRADMVPVKVHYCHCRMCQKAVGNVFATLVPLRRDRLEWTGRLSTYRSSSVAERGFCAACGTPLSFRYLDSDWMAVTLGSVDHPERLPPEIHYGVESRMPWLDIPDGLPRVRTEDDDPTGRLAGMVSHQHPDDPVVPDRGR